MHHRSCLHLLEMMTTSPLCQWPQLPTPTSVHWESRLVMPLAMLPPKVESSLREACSKFWQGSYYIVTSMRSSTWNLPPSLTRAVSVFLHLEYTSSLLKSGWRDAEQAVFFPCSYISPVLTMVTSMRWGVHNQSLLLSLLPHQALLGWKWKTKEKVKVFRTASLIFGVSHYRKWRLAHRGPEDKLGFKAAT